MKNTLKKLGAIALVLMLMMSLSVNAFAADFTDGVAGAWTEADKEKVQDKSINIKKEIISYNATSASVFAPAFSYTYTVTPATVSNYTVTDENKDHTSGAAVTAPVNPGITTGLTVNGGTAGTEASAVGTLAFTNTTALTTSSAGGSNLYNITLSFANVRFSQPGVYRYQIAETLADGKTYDGVAIEDGGTNTVYLDVYVDGAGKIYGYVCMAANSSVTPSTTKTNGFVGSGAGADKYYTYDLTLSKDVVNDNYAETNHAFPYTVIFNNSESYSTTFTITETAANGSTGISPTAASAPTWSGVAKVKEGANITYTGIPAGVDVDVYETNDMTGVTYTVATSVNSGTAVTDNGVIAGTAPTSAVAQTTKQAYESTKATVNTPKIATVSAAQTLAITNTLVLISPTGVAMRIAPYALMLIGGLVLLVISRRRKAEEA
jgi:hypothetical protein